MKPFKIIDLTSDEGQSQQPQLPSHQQQNVIPSSSLSLGRFSTISQPYQLSSTQQRNNFISANTYHPTSSSSTNPPNSNNNAGVIPNTYQYLASLQPQQQQQQQQYRQLPPNLSYNQTPNQLPNAPHLPQQTHRILPNSILGVPPLPQQQLPQRSYSLPSNQYYQSNLSHPNNVNAVNAYQQNLLNHQKITQQYQAPGYLPPQQNIPMIRVRAHFSLINSEEFTIRVESGSAVPPNIFQQFHRIQGLKFDWENKRFLFPIARHDYLHVRIMSPFFRLVTLFPLNSLSRISGSSFFSLFLFLSFFLLELLNEQVRI